MRWLQGTLICALTTALGGSGVGASVLLQPRQGNHVTARAPRDADSDKNGATPPQCHVERESKYPFCLPENNTEVVTGEIRYVTWDSDLFPPNSTITVGLNYVNSSGNVGAPAYTSDPRENGYGFVTIEMDKAWLQGESRNNLTVYIVEYNPGSKERAKAVAGPLISLVNKPAQHHPPPPHTPVPNKTGLMIGLPVALVVFFLILLGLCLGMRKNRRIGLGNIMGSRGKGYGGGKSRIERLGGAGGGRGRRRDRDAAAVRLGELNDDEQYTDDPRGGRIRSDAEIFNESERARGKAFRDELSRMKSWR